MWQYLSQAVKITDFFLKNQILNDQIINVGMTIFNKHWKSVCVYTQLWKKKAISSLSSTTPDSDQFITRELHELNWVCQRKETKYAEYWVIKPKIGSHCVDWGYPRSWEYRKPVVEQNQRCDKTLVHIPSVIFVFIRHVLMWIIWALKWRFEHEWMSAWNIYIVQNIQDSIQTTVKSLRRISCNWDELSVWIIVIKGLVTPIEPTAQVPHIIRIHGPYRIGEHLIQ